MLMIRLARRGARKQPHYRIVVIEKARARNGRPVEVVGTYNPRTNPASVDFKRDRVDRAVQFLGGQYRLIEDDRLLLFDGHRTLGLYDFRNDTLFSKDRSALDPRTTNRMTMDMQAMIQRHGEALVGNRLREP